MADTKAAPSQRTSEEIMAEYGRVCGELGNLTYLRDLAFPKLIAELIAKAETLNAENAAVLAAQTKESK